MPTVVAVLQHRTPNAADVPTATAITRAFWRALPARGFPVLGQGLRVTRVLRPTTWSTATRTQQGILAATAPTSAIPPELAYVLLGPLVAALNVGTTRALGTYYTTAVAVIDTDPTTDAAKAQRELLAGFRREFPADQGWFDLAVVDHREAANGLRDFWASGRAQRTRTRDRVPEVTDVVVRDENPTGPDPETTPEAIQARAAALVAAAERISAGAGRAVANVVGGALGGAAQQTGQGLLWLAGGALALVVVGVGLYAAVQGGAASRLLDAGRARFRRRPPRPSGEGEGDDARANPRAGAKLARQQVRRAAERIDFAEQAGTINAFDAAGLRDSLRVIEGARDPKLARAWLAGLHEEIGRGSRPLPPPSWPPPEAAWPRANEGASPGGGSSILPWVLGAAGAAAVGALAAPPLVRAYRRQVVDALPYGAALGPAYAYLSPGHRITLARGAIVQGSPDVTNTGRNVPPFPPGSASVLAGRGVIVAGAPGTVGGGTAANVPGAAAYPVTVLTPEGDLGDTRGWIWIEAGDRFGFVGQAPPLADVA